MKKLTSTVAVLLLSIGLAACQNGPTKQQVGTVGGAVAGGATASALGGGTAAVVGGSAVGALIGSEVGKNLDE